MDAILASVQAWPLSVAVAESSWLFPFVETLHVFGIALVIGSILMFDLRALELGWRSRPLAEMLRQVLPWTWCGFALAAVTGALMFISSAHDYGTNPAFLAKLVLLALAGLNMALFNHRLPAAQLEGGAELPQALRPHAAASAVLWIAIIFAGRWIGFV